MLKSIPKDRTSVVKMATASREWTPVRNLPLLLLRKREDPIRLVQEIHSAAGDYARGRLVGSTAYLISHPEAIRHVFYTNQHNYIRGEPRWSPGARTLGYGLLFAEGERHRQQRAFANPAFHQQQIAQYSRAVCDVAERLCREWQERSGTIIDIHQEMMRFTMIAIGKVLFDVDLSNEASRLGRIITDLLQTSNDLSMSPLIRFPWLPTAANRRLKRIRHTFDANIYEIMRKRRVDGTQGHDLLSKLLRASDADATRQDTSERLTDLDIRDVITSLLGAGFEPSANMLTWMWYLLARHPEVEARLHAELDDILGGRNPRFEDLRRLPYTEKVMCETLRLYPPVWLNRRKVIRSDTIQGYPVKANAIVFMSPYVVHRDPRWFRDPERFDPDRFAPERMAEQPKCAYFPFGGGSRHCIGQSFAEMEGLMLIAVLARHFTPRVARQEPVTPDAVFLRPKGGLSMRLVPRSGALE